MSIIENYFPNISTNQKEQFDKLLDLYKDWNNKINIISRKDIDNLYINHVLHSLSILKFITFSPSTTIIDVGTGGGFPGIPLAIMCENINFVLLDSIGKKIKVAQEISSSIGLKNIEFVNDRIENEQRKFNFVVSRGVMELSKLIKLTTKNINKKHQNSIPNGLICLKGGDLKEEIKLYKNKIEIIELKEYFDLPFFETKKILYVPL